MLVPQTKCIIVYHGKWLAVTPKVSLWKQRHAYTARDISTVHVVLLLLQAAPSCSAICAPGDMYQVRPGARHAVCLHVLAL